MSLSGLWIPLASEHSVFAGVGAEALITACSATQEPPATVGSGAAGRVNKTGDFGGEALPECGAQRWRAIVEALPGNLEMERRASHVFGDFVIELFTRRF